MEMSEKCGELFASFSKFQGELSNASKSKAGHGYKYADLAACIDMAKEHLAVNGLAVAQFLGDSDKGAVLTTMITHSSGQWMKDSFLMEKAVLQGGGGKNPAQAMGATITYMRRYAYAAIIGLAQEDEDATLAKGVDAVNLAIRSKNAEWVKQNWNTVVNKVWHLLNEQQTDPLNILINQESK